MRDAQRGDVSGLAVAILAAGQSARFGTQDKLTALLRGKPLGLHAITALTDQDFQHRWVIVRAQDHPCGPDWRSAGFELIVNSEAATGVSASLRCAAARAIQAQAAGLMVCLADMPLIPAEHIAALIQAWSQHGGVVASQDGALISPPAIFSANHFAALAALTGDQGAKSLLAEALHVASPPGALADVDDPETLKRLSA